MTSEISSELINDFSEIRNGRSAIMEMLGIGHQNAKEGKIGESGDQLKQILKLFPEVRDREAAFETKHHVPVTDQKLGMMLSIENLVSLIVDLHNKVVVLHGHTYPDAAPNFEFEFNGGIKLEAPAMKFYGGTHLRNSFPYCLGHIRQGLEVFENGTEETMSAVSNARKEFLELVVYHSTEGSAHLLGVPENGFIQKMMSAGSYAGNESIAAVYQIPGGSAHVLRVNESVPAVYQSPGGSAHVLRVPENGFIQKMISAGSNAIKCIRLAVYQGPEASAHVLGVLQKMMSVGSNANNESVAVYQSPEGSAYVLGVSENGTQNATNEYVRLKVFESPETRAHYQITKQNQKKEDHDPKVAIGIHDTVVFLLQAVLLPHLAAQLGSASATSMDLFLASAGLVFHAVAVVATIMGSLLRLKKPWLLYWSFIVGSVSTIYAYLLSISLYFPGNLRWLIFIPCAMLVPLLYVAFN